MGDRNPYRPKGVVTIHCSITSPFSLTDRNQSIVASSLIPTQVLNLILTCKIQIESILGVADPTFAHEISYRVSHLTGRQSVGHARFQPVQIREPLPAGVPNFGCAPAAAARVTNSPHVVLTLDHTLLLDFWMIRITHKICFASLSLMQ